MTQEDLTGGCACGAVRYTSTASPGFSFHCQCRQCQRSTGGGHASAMVFRADAVTITGEIRFYDQTSDEGNIVSRGFCPACGSPLLNRNAAHPGTLYVHAATLDDPSQFHPTTVIFTANAQPWDRIDLDP